MGRAKGDPARSKSRPSSSSLAASLLQAPGAAASVGFGGYVGSSRVDIASPFEGEVSLDVDGEAALHLRRLSKKDPITKLKALGALKEFFKDHTANELSPLLINWVFEYKRLVVDNNRQVRESTHLAMADLASTIGRGLAPHLKSLMGAWWVAQFDPSREVAEAAQRSFQVAFPGQKKRVEVLIFCLNDTISHLDENLKLTPATISDTTTPPEEASEKHERVLSSSLLALAATLDVLVGGTAAPMQEGITDGDLVSDTASKAREAAKEAASTLCSNHKLLQSFLKSPSSQVRSASYQAVRACIQHIPQVFAEYGKFEAIVGTVLGALGEKDAACHQSMWDMVLLFAKRFPHAWGFGCIRKAVLPKLWGFLEHQCFGSQQISYPNLLPLLALIPPIHMAPAQGFFTEFFNNLWQGHSAVASSDRLALSKGFQECFVWVLRNVKRYAVEEGAKVEDFQDFLVHEVLLKILCYDYMGLHVEWPRNKVRHTTHQSHLVSKADKDGVNQQLDSTLPVTVAPSRGSEYEGREKLTSSTHDQSLLEVGSTIVDIIIALSSYENRVLDTFWPEFHTLCLNIIQESGSVAARNDQRLHRIARFFHLLCEKKSAAGVRRKNWPLQDAVQPFVARTFSVIKSTGHPEAISLLAQLTSLYGTPAFASTKDSATYSVLQFYKCELLPWCLTENNELTAPKIELLLSFLETDEFRGEWDVTLAYVTEWERETDEQGDIAHDKFAQVAVLATLVEKMRERWGRLTANKDQKTAIMDWNSPRFDDAAIRVAHSKQLPHPACLRLLRALLGETGHNEEEHQPLISCKAAVCILEQLLQHMLTILHASHLQWAKAAPLYILSGGPVDGTSNAQTSEDLTAEAFELAMASTEVIKNSVTSVTYVESESQIGYQVLSALFCLDWAFSGSRRKMLDAREEGHESEEDSLEEDGDINEVSLSLSVANEETVIRREAEGTELFTQLEQSQASLTRCLQTVRQQALPLICHRFNSLSRQRVRYILIQCVRHAVIYGSFERSHFTAALCAGWVSELVDYFCIGDDEIQETISLSLASSMSWPVWAEIPLLDDDSLPILRSPAELKITEEERHKQVAAFADLLAISLGPERVYAGCPSGVSETGSGSSRVWLIVELLCTLEWPRGSAVNSVVPFLCECAKKSIGEKPRDLLESCLQSLFSGSLTYQKVLIQSPAVANCEKDEAETGHGPFMSRLLMLLEYLLGRDGPWGKADAQRIFFQCVAKSDPICSSSLWRDTWLLPFILPILMPVLRKKSSNPASTQAGHGEDTQLQTTVCNWLTQALAGPPLVALEAGPSASEGELWVRVVVACFPLSPYGSTAAMVAASSADVTDHERDLLLKLLQKQFSQQAVSSSAAQAALQRLKPNESLVDVNWQQTVELTLAKLVASCVAYCWQDFGVEEWRFVLGHLGKWLASAVVDAEDVTEAVVDILKVAENSRNGVALANPNDSSIQSMSFTENSVAADIEDVIMKQRNLSAKLSTTAVTIFSLLKEQRAAEGEIVVTSSMVASTEANWERSEGNAMGDILRLLLATGLAESAAADSVCAKQAADVIAKHRESQEYMWEIIAEVALSASGRARESAVRSADLWGVGKGSISALYALLFSCTPIPCLQRVAFQFLSTVPLQHLAITWGVVGSAQEEQEADNGQTTTNSDVPPAAAAGIRPELATVLETPGSLVLQTSLTAPIRIQYLLGWSLFLMRLHTLPALSGTRERLLQYAQDSNTTSTLLDCLFQHIPLEQNSGTTGARKRNRVVGAKESTGSAARAAANCSVESAVQDLWPVTEAELAILSGALYGLMLRVLPACVRIWYTGLRDRSTASGIETFTTTHCSPQLLAYEFSQVQASAVADEALSIRANRTLREVTAIYKKEEAGMDIVIRLPACYPLRVVEVECTRRLGISEALLRKWILSMAAFLRNQNGALSEAVQMWKRNVDREFEGVEECPICYSIIHTSNHTLPGLACKTCKHKFHSACLYKWFSTSHKSTCPLCQTPF